MQEQPHRRELAIFTNVLRAGEPRHALEHLARAFALAPFDEEVHAALASVARDRDVLGLIPPDDAFVGTHLLRAHALHRAGRLDECVVALAIVAEQLPELGVEVTLASWLVTAQAQGLGLGDPARAQLARLLTVAACEGTIGLHRLRAGERALLAGYGELAEACAGLGGSVAAAAAGVLRRVGKYDVALAAVEGRDDELARIQRGLTLRAMGEGARSAETFARLASMSPTDNYRIEEARSWFVEGAFAKAAALLDAGPPSGDEEVERLRAACDAGPGGDRVDLLDRIRRAQLSPDVRTPTDATANVFLENRATLRPGGSRLQLAIRGWEAPSNRLLAALYASGTTDVRGVEYVMTTPPLPFDPVSQRRGGGTPLWVAEDDAVVQGAAEPDVELRGALAKVATGEDGLEEIWDRAARLAESLDGSRAGEIAAAMVFPPTDPDWLDRLPEALFRYQVACACAIAALPGPWSARRALLESILFGPIDWSSAAAVIALGQLAQRDAAAAREARALLSELVADLLPHSCEPRFWPLAVVLGACPAVAPSTRSALRAFHREHVAPGETDARPPEPESTPPARRAAPPRPPAPAAIAPGAGARMAAVTKWIAVAIVAFVILAMLLR